MSSPYIDGLKMLGRRELSEAQVRQRLTRKGHGDEDIDAASGRGDFRLLKKRLHLITV